MASIPPEKNVPFSGTAPWEQGAGHGSDGVVFHSVPPDTGIQSVLMPSVVDPLNASVQSPALAPVSGHSTIAINVGPDGEIIEEPAVTQNAPKSQSIAVVGSGSQSPRGEKFLFSATPHPGGSPVSITTGHEFPSRQGMRPPVLLHREEKFQGGNSAVNTLGNSKPETSPIKTNAHYFGADSLGSMKARLETSGIQHSTPKTGGSSPALSSGVTAQSHVPTGSAAVSVWETSPKHTAVPQNNGVIFMEPEKLAFGEARIIEKRLTPPPRESVLGEIPPPVSPPIPPWLATQQEDQSVQKTPPVLSERGESEERIIKERLTALHIQATRQSAEPTLNHEQAQTSTENESISSDDIAPQTKQVIERDVPVKEQVQKISSLRTYKSDVVSMLRSQNQTVSRIVLAEQRRNLQSEELQKKEKHTSWLNTIIITISLLFIAGGAGAISFMLWTSFNSNQGEATRLSLSRSFIVTEKQSRIDTTSRQRQEIVGLIEEKVNGAELPINHIEGIIFTKTTRPTELFEKPEDVSYTPVTLTELFFALDEGVPPSLIRSLNDTFLFGIHSYIGNKPFLVIDVASHTQAFAEMLKWEPYMAANLATLFSIKNQGKFRDISFSDAVIKNQDARLIKDVNGAVYLIYAFIGKNTLIITTNETTFDELLKRLQTPKEVVR